MQAAEGGNGMGTGGKEATAGSSAGQEEPDCREFMRSLLNLSSLSGKEYRSILADCDKLGLSERELWDTLALYLKKGETRERGCQPLELGDGPGERVRKRILSLVGMLPYEKLDEFRGLIAFTTSFLKRTAFVCDLLVYLFAEREKGMVNLPGIEIDTRAYTDFFAGKFFWELEKIRQLGEETSLRDLDQAYLEWLADRILDGEVLA
jgi:hypothetical protein